MHAILPWVREFYSNFNPKSDKLEVCVRGKTIPFDRSSINKFLELTDIEDDGYQKELASPDLDALLSTLCIPNSQWTMAGGKRVNFKKSSLLPTLKPWYLFICASAIPTKHDGDVTIPRAVLLYALYRHLSIDVGLVLQQSIQQCMEMKTSAGLALPSLITQLCKSAGLVSSPDDELLPPMSYISKATNKRIRAQATPPIPAPPPQPLTTRQWVATLAQNQLRYFQYRESFDAALVQRLLHPDQPPMQFPAFPHYDYANIAIVPNANDDGNAEVARDTVSDGYGSDSDD